MAQHVLRAMADAQPCTTAGNSLPVLSFHSAMIVLILMG
jgi:hypothetical protein